MLKYFTSREFFLTLAGLTGAGVFLYFMLFFWLLPIYTRHGDSVLVPDVSEMSLADATRAIRDAGLRPGEPDSIFVEHQAPGAVVKQYPPPYSRVKPRRTVALTINKREPPLVALPDIRDLLVYQAKARLESWKLSIGTVTRVPDIGENKVLRVTFRGAPVEPGTQVPQGSKIDVVVGAGLVAGKRVALPDLLGLSYEEALSMLRAAGLSTGAIHYKPDGPADAAGTVYDQNPRITGYNDSIQAGQAVDLYIYGSAPTENEQVIMQQVEGGR
ncbi:MAG: PASTA domain-containing protein [Bacteroidia bacterium]|nr:PASTA domain-containing protein [Bacteroidia bacterium]